MADPQTAAEWQEAVDIAHAFVEIESARAYGLITGGPKIDVQRCLDLLGRGVGLGYRPSPGATERLLQELSC